MGEHRNRHPTQIELLKSVADVVVIRSGQTKHQENTCQFGLCNDENRNKTLQRRMICKGKIKIVSGRCIDLKNCKRIWMYDARNRWAYKEMNPFKSLTFAVSAFQQHINVNDVLESKYQLERFLSRLGQQLFEICIKFKGAGANSTADAFDILR